VHCLISSFSFLKALTKQMNQLLDQMFLGGLSLPLTEALEDLGHHIPSLLSAIQGFLLLLLFYWLFFFFFLLVDETGSSMCLPLSPSL